MEGRSLLAEAQKRNTIAMFSRVEGLAEREDQPALLGQTAQEGLRGLAGHRQGFGRPPMLSTRVPNAGWMVPKNPMLGPRTGRGGKDWPASS
jgi:hypothetical protein